MDIGPNLFHLFLFGLAGGLWMCYMMGCFNKKENVRYFEVPNSKYRLDKAQSNKLFNESYYADDDAFTH